MVDNFKFNINGIINQLFDWIDNSLIPAESKRSMKAVILIDFFDSWQIDGMDYSEVFDEDLLLDTTLYHYKYPFNITYGISYKRQLFRYLENLILKLKSIKLKKITDFPLYSDPYIIFNDYSLKDDLEIENILLKHNFPKISATSEIGVIKDSLSSFIVIDKYYFPDNYGCKLLDSSKLDALKVENHLESYNSYFESWKNNTVTLDLWLCYREVDVFNSNYFLYINEQLKSQIQSHQYTLYNEYVEVLFSKEFKIPFDTNKYKIQLATKDLDYTNAIIDDNIPKDLKYKIECRFANLNFEDIENISTDIATLLSNKYEKLFYHDIHSDFCLANADIILKYKCFLEDFIQKSKKANLDVENIKSEIPSTKSKVVSTITTDIQGIKDLSLENIVNKESPSLSIPITKNIIHNKFAQIFTYIEFLSLPHNFANSIRSVVLIDFFDSWQFDDEKNNISFDDYISSPAKAIYFDIKKTFGIKNIAQVNRYISRFLNKIKLIKFEGSDNIDFNFPLNIDTLTNIIDPDSSSFDINKFLKQYGFNNVNIDTIVSGVYQFYYQSEIELAKSINFTGDDILSITNKVTSLLSFDSLMSYFSSDTTHEYTDDEVSEYINDWIHGSVTLDQWQNFKHFDLESHIDEWDLSEDILDSIRDHRFSLYNKLVNRVFENTFKSKFESLQTYETKRSIAQKDLALIDDLINGNINNAKADRLKSIFHVSDWEKASLQLDYLMRNKYESEDNHNIHSKDCYYVADATLKYKMFLDDFLKNAETLMFDKLHTSSEISTSNPLDSPNKNIPNSTHLRTFTNLLKSFKTYSGNFFQYYEEITNSSEALKREILDNLLLLSAENKTIYSKKIELELNLFNQNITISDFFEDYNGFDLSSLKSHYESTDPDIKIEEHAFLNTPLNQSKFNTPYYIQRKSDIYNFLVIVNCKSILSLFDYANLPNNPLTENISATPKHIESIKNTTLKYPVNSKIYSYKYRKYSTNLSAITDLFNSLKGKYIREDTELTNFRKVFNNSIPDCPIIWIGGITSLHYFIKSIYSLNLVDNEFKDDKWKIASSLFVDANRQYFDRDNLRTTKRPANTDLLDKAINHLK